MAALSDLTFASGFVLPVEQAAPDPDAKIVRRARLALLLTAGFIATVAIGGAIVPLGGAVVAPGQVGVEGHVKRVTHPTGGTIAAIFVKNGDHVVKGQPLIRLDDTVAGADASLMTLTVDQLLAQRARLEAERIGAGAIDFSTLATRGAGAQRAIADENRLFTTRRAEQAGMIAQLDQRIRQYQEQITGYRRQIDALGRQQALITPEKNGLESLYKKGLVTISRYNQLARSQADLDGSIASLQAQIAATEARITETREQMIQTRDSARSDAGSKLAEVNAQLNQQQVRSIAAGDTASRTMIRAPYTGTVDKLAYATIGDVVKPADPIMEIVPTGDAMVIELSVPPEDVDRVHVGQPARVRFSTLNSAQVPEAAGHVIALAPDRSVEQQTGRSYYMARVRLDDPLFTKRHGTGLRTGVPAEVFLSTGSRTMFSYLTKPLRDQFERAFRDDN
jgi:HlyD family secretion protein